MLAEFQELFDYNRWANHRMLAAARALTPEDLERDLRSSFPSILATFRHMLGAEWVWVERFHGRSPRAAPGGWGTASLEDLARQWAEVEEGQRAFLASLPEESLETPLSYRNLAGVASTQKLREVLRHVINHSTYHRGQVTTMLRQLGATPPGTDLILYYRERPAQALPEPGI